MSYKEIKVYRRVLWVLQVDDNKVGVKSTVFEIALEDNITKWSLKFFPNGFDNETESYIGVCLKLNSATSTEFSANYSFGVLGNDGENFVSESSIKAGESFIKKPGGIGRLIHHEILFNQPELFVNEGHLTIVCELALTAKKKLQINKEDNYSSHFEKMLNDELFADINLKTRDGKMLKAHKSILASRSPMFFDLFKSEMQSVSNLEITDSEKTMKEILRYIYCEKVNLDEVTRDLILAAHKYQLEDLKELCIDKIISKLTTKNVIDMFQISIQISGCRKLYNSCIELINRKYHIIAKTEEWKLLPEKLIWKVQHERFCKSRNVIYI